MRVPGCIPRPSSPPASSATNRSGSSGKVEQRMTVAHPEADELGGAIHDGEPNRALIKRGGAGEVGDGKPHRADPRLGVDRYGGGSPPPRFPCLPPFPGPV